MGRVKESKAMRRVERLVSSKEEAKYWLNRIEKEICTIRAAVENRKLSGRDTDPKDSQMFVNTMREIESFIDRAITKEETKEFTCRLLVQKSQIEQLRKDYHDFCKEGSSSDGSDKQLAAAGGSSGGGSTGPSVYVSWRQRYWMPSVRNDNPTTEFNRFLAETYNSLQAERMRQRFD